MYNVMVSNYYIKCNTFLLHFKGSMILKHYYYIDILLLHCKLLRNFFGGVYGN